MTPHDIVLPGSSKSTDPLKECCRCGVKKDPRGGIELSPGKWRCAQCWRGFALRKNA